MYKIVKMAIALFTFTMVWSTVYGSTRHPCPAHNYYKPESLHVGCCKQCKPGTFLAKYCSHTYGESRCHPCPSGSFMDIANNATQCKRCSSICVRGTIKVQDCSLETDMKCVCGKGKFLENPFDVCADCRQCQPGEELTQQCTHLNNTQCRKCPNGTYSEDGVKCNQCTSCSSDEKLVKPCDLAENTKCKLKKRGDKDAAAITGGVVGSFFGIVLLVLFAIVMIKRRQKRTDDTYKTTRSPSLTATTNSSLNSLQGQNFKLEDFEAIPGSSTPHTSGSKALENNNPDARNISALPVRTTSPYSPSPVPSPSATDSLLFSQDLFKSRKIVDLSYETRQKLTEKLLSTRRNNNWKNLAGQLGYSYEKIAFFETSGQAALNQLLDDFQGKPDGYVSVLYRALEKIDRHDCLELLREYLS